MNSISSFTKFLNFFHEKVIKKLPFDKIDTVNWELLDKSKDAFLVVNSIKLLSEFVSIFKNTT